MTTDVHTIDVVNISYFVHVYLFSVEYHGLFENTF